jgi:hypothetical protein
VLTVRHLEILFRRHEVTVAVATTGNSARGRTRALHLLRGGLARQLGRVPQLGALASFAMRPERGDDLTVDR